MITEILLHSVYMVLLCLLFGDFFGEIQQFQDKINIAIQMNTVVACFPNLTLYKNKLTMKTKTKFFTSLML